MTNLAIGPPPQLSQDGHWRWDGHQWEPTQPPSPEHRKRSGPVSAQLSPDGCWWWNGREWAPAEAIRPRPRASRRRRVMWIVVAVLGGLVAFGGLGYGLDQVLKVADTYQADLTIGHGDFPASTVGNTSTSYHKDGFHLWISRAGGVHPSAVEAPRPYIAAEVTVTATQVSSPAYAAFGPWCFSDESNGYGMDLAADGYVAITRLRDGKPTVIGDGQAAAWRPGQTRKLAIVCRLTDTGDEISAYVNGVKVATATRPPDLREIRATGFTGFVPLRSSGPGEWIITSFSRRNPLA
jgi:hypothetical protein